VSLTQKPVYYGESKDINQSIKLSKHRNQFSMERPNTETSLS